MPQYSFLEDEQLVTHKLRAYLKKLFTERTLVVYDVRSSIIPEV